MKFPVRAVFAVLLSLLAWAAMIWWALVLDGAVVRVFAQTAPATCGASADGGLSVHDSVGEAGGGTSAREAAAPAADRSAGSHAGEAAGGKGAAGAGHDKGGHESGAGGHSPAR